MNKTFLILAWAAFSLVFAAKAGDGGSGTLRSNPDAKLHRFSTVVEKERPELSAETKRLIAAYHRNPTEANKAALRRECAKNYDNVLARKKAKLEELKHTAKHQSKVDEMQDIVDEMIANRDLRIDETMSRFTDTRFGARREIEAGRDYLPLLGAGQNVSIAYAPVTNAEYAKFSRSNVAPGKERHPVTNISVAEAEKYCQWLNRNDPAHTYRLPTEKEWELAAGHMPKDADFNCGERDGTSAIDDYAQTKGACGGIDFWGNCWEWTSTKRNSTDNAVKGGAFDSKRTDCRTESKASSRKADGHYGNVTIRLVRES